LVIFGGGEGSILFSWGGQGVIEYNFVEIFGGRMMGNQFFEIKNKYVKKTSNTNPETLNKKRTHSRIFLSSS
jgi:hypothetical protein